MGRKVLSTMPKRTANAVKTAVTDDQLGHLGRRLDDLKRRIQEGTIPFDWTMEQLQGVIEEKGAPRVLGPKDEFLIDHTTAPALGKFLPGWTLHEEDPFNLTKLDPAKFVFKVPLEAGGTRITGHVKLEKEKANSGLIRLPWWVGWLLLYKKEQETLRLLHKLYGVEWMELTGSTVRSPDGNLYFFVLCRVGDGGWRWDCNWLDDYRNADDPSARVRK